MLRRFASGEVVEHIVFVLFGVFDPCRAAGGEDGEFTAILDASDDFASFFDGGDFGAESRIIDGVETDFPHGGDHFSHDVDAGFKSKFFAESDANGRSDLRDDDGVGIVDGRPDFVVVGVGDDGADGADGGALTAVDAIDVGEGESESGFDFGALSAPSEAENADALEFGASADAVTAEDAFSGVADERGRGGVDGFSFHELVVGVSVDGEASSEFL